MHAGVFTACQPLLHSGPEVAFEETCAGAQQSTPVALMELLEIGNLHLAGATPSSPEANEQPFAHEVGMPPQIAF
jgi:hypothetical protein